ncbi:MAG: LamG domain-containing protein [Cyclobacteriaceae bacterium]|nr:LamG domain-containing protein [Cyclobacteriaceae bacterium]
MPAPNGVTQYEVINIGHIKTYLKDLEISGSNVIWFEQSQLSLLDSMSEIASSGDYYLASIDGNCRSLDLTKVSVAVNSNLLLFYDMNDNCQDLSSNVFDGVFNGSYAPGIDGLGNAATFNGVDQYIEFPNDLALKPDFPMSFSYWIKFDDLNVNNAVVFTTDYVENSHTGVWMTLSSVGELSVNIGNGTGTTSVSRKTFIVNTPININTWYHVGAVLESIDSFKIYMNGILQDGNYAGSASSLVYTEFPGSIGRKDGSTLADPYYFKGQLDDFSYWGRVLSETEINKLMGN